MRERVVLQRQAPRFGDALAHNFGFDDIGVLEKLRMTLPRRLRLRSATKDECYGQADDDWKAHGVPSCHVW